ncbi:hypothetical protein [Francisella sp. SYW-9]|nr:hypothetical protein [Francisella sp. SYW-9]
MRKIILAVSMIMASIMFSFGDGLREIGNYSSANFPPPVLELAM